MNIRTISGTLITLLGELLNGAPSSSGSAYMLNQGDVGLHASLDRLSAAAASTASAGGASIAAHVDHLRYGLSLMNRWASGEQPFRDADWSASWRITAVADAEWERLRHDLRHEGRRWLDALGTPREVDEAELDGVIGSIVHLAYHLGAIRQIDRAARGPAQA